MKKIITIFIILLITNIAQADKPIAIQEKIDAIRNSTQSKVRQNYGTQKISVSQNEWLLVHDGKKILQNRKLDPMERMIVPSYLTVFINTKDQVMTEIKRLKLEKRNILQELLQDHLD